MTTHDQDTEVTHSADGIEPSTERHDHATEQADSASVTREPSTVPAEPSTAPAEPSAASAEPPAAPANGSSDQPESSTERELFADDHLAGLRARWDNVQAGFVDDPRECVQKADSLVSDVVEQLTTGFAQARSRLEEQWARGEEASTEDLRVALKRYREFFERLLAV
jgi:hypothetical protein